MFPKPKSALVDRVAYKREREARERAFKITVWMRDGARCRYCDRKVVHTFELTPQRGEVHHRRGRNVTPEDRFNVDAAVLLCLKCHRDPAVVAFYRRMDKEKKAR